LPGSHPKQGDENLREDAPRLSEKQTRELKLISSQPDLAANGLFGKPKIAADLVVGVDLLTKFSATSFLVLSELPGSTAGPRRYAGKFEICPEGTPDLAPVNPISGHSALPLILPHPFST
jgi:hypothetical protein